MYKLRAQLFIALGFLTLSACSMFGDVSVKIAPFELTEADGVFALRHYEQLVLVSTKMPEGMSGASGPFRRLFDYIYGNNEKKEQIAMTAHVFLDQVGQTTGPMSFVLPDDRSLKTAPPPF